MPLPAVIPAAGAGLKIAKGIFGGIKGLFGKKKKQPAPQPTAAQTQASSVFSRLAQQAQQVLARTQPPAPVSTGIGMDRSDKPPMSFGGFAAPETSASAAGVATMPPKQAANLAMPVLILIVVIFLFLLKRR